METEGMGSRGAAPRQAKANIAETAAKNVLGRFFTKSAYDVSSMLKRVPPKAVPNVAATPLAQAQPSTSKRSLSNFLIWLERKRNE